MQEVMNLKIKFRESFRPFAPVVLEEHAANYWDCRPGDVGPYMMTVMPLREERRLATRSTGLGCVNEIRSDIPAVTHVDYSARIQTVDAKRHGRFHRLLAAFYEQTGCPVLINTSFNVRGEPIVNTPLEAWNCFAATNIDALVIGSFIVLRSRQTAVRQSISPDEVNRLHSD
jgi:carbamoyltransferase